MSGIQAKKVIKYVVLPGIIPRAKRFLTSGFGYLAFLMAQIYSSVRLLPRNHPYLHRGNINKFGLRHVIAEAANNLVFSKKNIDQILVFGLIITALILLIAQFGLLIFGFFIGIANAGGGPLAPVINGDGIPGFISFFVTANPTHDIAFIMLDQVFGLPNFFNSCIAQNVACTLGSNEIPPSETFPWPFHIALHQMFRFYSLAMLIVGALIFLYFIVVIVAETATTGTPFGQRFQNVWVPIRLIMAIGLLVPLPITYPGAGTTAAYNSGQYITFFVAKVGSSLATNAWTLFNSSIADNMEDGKANPTGQSNTLIALPNSPDAAIIVETMSMIHTCKFTYYKTDDNVRKQDGDVGIKYNTVSAHKDKYQELMYIGPYLVKQVDPYLSAENEQAAMPVAALGRLTASPAGAVPVVQTYEQALNFFYNSNIRIRFGRYDPVKYINETGNVAPLCGEIIIPISDARLPSATSGQFGAARVQEYYFNLIQQLWWGKRSHQYIDFAGRFSMKNLNNKIIIGGVNYNACAIGCDNRRLPDCPGIDANDAAPCAKDEIEAIWKEAMIADLQPEIDTALYTIWQAYNNDGTDYAMRQNVMDGNWGNAGTWFPTLARVNGAFMDAFQNTPRLEVYPMVMEQVREQRKKSSPFLSGSDQFNPSERTDQINFGSMLNVHEIESASILHRLYTYWNGDQKSFMSMDKIIKGSGIEDGMNMIFGTEGLFDMRQNRQVHPLAALTSLGKGLVEASIRNVAMSTMAAGLGGMMRAVDKTTGAAAEAISGFLVSTAFIGLSAGVVLFYIVPFLPFLYFFFAVGEWVKAIFEAMVGVPLWALAHLRLDGDGLPGEAASNGYFLLLEIFIRPILTVAGLIAALVIFTAQAYILNAIWAAGSEVVGNPTENAATIDAAFTAIPGFSYQRTVIDSFFYTIVYAIIMYMAATASFKLINTIPDNILRWTGQGVSSFGDINQDPAEGITQYAALGGITAGQKLAGATNELSKGLGGALGNVAKGS